MPPVFIEFSERVFYELQMESSVPVLFLLAAATSGLVHATHNIMYILEKD